jgi:hypothetical protein
VGKACCGWELGLIQRACLRGLHLDSVGQACDNEFVSKLYVGEGGAGGEEVAHCTRVQNCPFVDGVHVDVDCEKECSGGKCILGGDWVRR